MQGSTYRRTGLVLVLLSAAVPFRIFGEFPVVNSFSVLDIALVIAGATLVLRASTGGSIEFGDHRLFALLCVLPLLSIVSLLWAQDPGATALDAIAYLECILAYVYALTQTQGVPPQTIIKWLRWFTYAILVPPALMLLHVPGFAPQEPGLSESSGDYLSYFTRLSHPFLGRSNNLATVLAMVVPVLLYWGAKHHHRATTRAGIVALVAVVLTVSRGVLISLILAAIVVWVLRGLRIPAGHGRQLGFALIGAMLASLVAAVLFYRFNQDTHLFIGDRTNLSNVVLREDRLSAGFNALWERPFLGYGSGSLPNGDLAIAGGVHNTYLQQLLSYGVFLGALAIFSLVEIVRFFLGGGSYGLRQVVGLTLLVQLFSYMVESSFEGSLLRVVIYLLVGMLVGLLRESAADPVEMQVERALAR